MAQRSLSESDGADLAIPGLGAKQRGLPVDAASRMGGDRETLGQGLTLGRSDGVHFNGLIVESDRNSGIDPSVTEFQSRLLLVAVLGAWTGFLGLMGVVVTENAFQKILGAVALICGLIVVFVGLIQVVRDRPDWVGAGDPFVDDGRHDRVR